MSRLNNISYKHELMKTCAFFLSEATGKKFTLKLLKDTYKKWAGSTYPKSMCFGEFVKRMYGDE